MTAGVLRRGRMEVSGTLAHGCMARRSVRVLFTVAWLASKYFSSMIDQAAIREGLSRDEFFLEYLPTISLTDGRCVGAEALIRWRRPEGIVSPGDFIPIAENTPLSGLLTYWVLDTVAAELGDWLRANPDVRLAINVPPEILGRGGLGYVANKSGLAQQATQIILEVTERGL